MPKVSIVLPTYNGQKYIRDSIDSVIAQTFTDWELIIVNDCSTDDTPKIIREYEKRDNRIKIIDNEVNQKLPTSLNIGFRKAQGEYLTWTSDDNMYMPEAIEKLSAYLDANKDIMMVCSAMKFIDENGNYITCNSSAHINEKIFCVNNVGASFMYRGKVICEVGEYNPEFFLVEDYEYWLRIMFQYGDIGYLDEKLYIYREQSGSLTATRAKDIRFNLAKLKKIYADKLINRLRNNKNLLCALYYEMCMYNIADDDVKKKVLQYVPELRIDNIIELDEKFIVYGAGDYGNKAYKEYGDRIVCYVDRDEKKVGTYINGIEVKHISEILNHDYQILVAAYREHIMSFLIMLLNYNIEKCKVYIPNEGDL